jgi:hypothetical protein
MASIFELEQPVFDRMNDSVGLVAASDAATTLTAAQSVNSLVVMTPTAGRNVTTATAVAIVAELGSGVRVGTTFRIILRNQAAATHAMTLVGGTGVTLDADNTNTAAAASTREFIGRVTAIASGSEAITVYSMPSGTH